MQTAFPTEVIQIFDKLCYFSNQAKLSRNNQVILVRFLSIEVSLQAAKGVTLADQRFSVDKLQVCKTSCQDRLIGKKVDIQRFDNIPG